MGVACILKRCNSPLGIYSSIISILSGGILMSIGSFPEMLSRRILVGMISFSRETGLYIASTNEEPLVDVEVTAIDPYTAGAYEGRLCRPRARQAEKRRRGQTDGLTSRDTAHGDSTIISPTIISEERILYLKKKKTKHNHNLQYVARSLAFHCPERPCLPLSGEALRAPLLRGHRRGRPERARGCAAAR